jgi:hypothetical protein
MINNLRSVKSTMTLAERKQREKEQRREHILSAAEPPIRQIIDVLQQVMCTHDAEKLAISVLEICGEYLEPLLR